MPDVYLDAYAVALDSDTTAARDEYVSQLLELRRLQQQRWVRIVSAADASELLAKTQSYPVWVGGPHSREIARHDIVTLVYSLLGGTTAEDVAQVVELVCVTSACNPDSHLVNRPQLFIEHHHHLLGLAAFRQEQAGGRDPIVWTRGTANTTSAVTVMGSALIQRVETNEPEETEYRIDAALVENLAGFIGLESASALWQLSGCERAAIEMRTAQRQAMQGGALIWPINVICALGSEFLQSAQALGFCHETAKIERLLNASADTLLQLNTGKPH